MSAAYLLSFSLALTPILMQLVAVVFFMLAIGRAVAPANNCKRPSWQFFAFSLFGFALSIWQSLYISLLFSDWRYDFEAQSVEVLGVVIPLALGETIKSFVDAAFFMLINASTVIFVLVLIFFPKRFGKPRYPTWILRCWLAALFVLYIWVSRRTWSIEFENIRALF